MTDKRRLSAEEWALARKRWEGDPRPGFDWLAKEMAAAFGLHVIRQTVSVRATREVWEKVDGAVSEPLAPVAQQPGDVAQHPAPVAQHGKPTSRKSRAAEPEVADEVVDAPAAPAPALAAKPVGYVGTGRPSLYRPEYDEAIMAWFDQSPWEDVPVEQMSGVVKLQRMPKAPPMLAGFAKSIGVSTDTVNRWATEADELGRPRYPGFAEAYARARELNEANLASAGLLGIYDNRVIQFVLKNLYGWQDQPARRVEVAPISKEELEATFIARMTAAHERMALVLAERDKQLRQAEQAELAEPDGPGEG